MRSATAVAVAAATAVAFVACGVAVSGQRSSHDQAKLLQRITELSTSGGYEGMAAGMALENGQLAMACHFGDRSVATVGEIQTLVAKLTPEARAKFTSYDRMIDRANQASAALKMICPPP